jgi:hypothetical protein
MRLRVWRYLLPLFLITSGAASADAAPADAPGNDATSAWRALACAANGGRDITAQGHLSVGEDVTAVVVCQYPAASADAATPRAKAALGVGGPIQTSPVTATLHPPAGDFSLAAGNPLPVSCSTDLAIARWPNLPAVSNGTSKFNCRGYNVNQSSVGCGVQWSGPTSVTVGATPYGGSASVSFTCAATHLGAFSTVMDYSYNDPTYQRITYSAQGVFGTINVRP